MNQSNILSLFTILLLFISATFAQDKEFVVKPEGKDTVELVHGDYKCTFSYECSGGSSEKWMMTIVKDDNNLLCMIGRPAPPSYILFKDINVSFTNGKKHFQTVDIMDNDGSLLLNDHYKIEKNQVVPGKNWNKNIIMISLTLNTK